MYKILILFLISFLFFPACADKTTQQVEIQTTTIAFGSCSWHDHPLPIFNNIIEHQPDMFIFLGDNIYGDTRNMDTLRAKYGRLAAKESFQNLITNTEILATWDDHDFGWNDAGREYEHKEEAKEIFLDFFNEPDTSARRNHAGIYHSYDYKIGDKTLQVILLDGRTFRDKIKSYDGEFDDDRRFSFYKNDYAPHTTADSTFLGKEQWLWLDKQLQKSADIRLIGSGTQFGIEWNGYEAWANFPHEQQKMLDLIKKNKANGVIFLTGDVHYSEISKVETDFYPIYDFTSSGLSSAWYFATPNKNRIEGPVMDNHFGLITIDWLTTHPQIKMETWDIRDNQRMELTVGLDEISFDK